MQAITELRKTGYYIPGFTDETGHSVFSKDVAVGHSRIEGVMYVQAAGWGRTTKEVVVGYEDDEITTVGELVAALQKFPAEMPVKICTDFPSHKGIAEVKIPASNITAECVAIYSE